MNWNIFYIINQGFLDLLFIGATYITMTASMFLAIKLLTDSLNNEK